MSEERAGIEIVVAPSEIDAAERDDFERRLSAVPPHADLVIDLSAVSFCDSSALGALLSADARQREGGGSCTLRQVPRQLERLLEITNLSDHFATD